MGPRIVILAGLLLAGCKDSSLTSSEIPSGEKYGKLAQVPAAMIGQWKYVGQECEADSEELPDRAKRNITITFRNDFRYEMNVEGWEFVGVFHVDRFRDAPDRIQLNETLYEFNLVNGRMENWGEGEAPYICGNLFNRVGNSIH